ncbi:MAG: hypothetical protein GY870_01380 [archaeon]|nr:hypothetical protein [archaeon]
MRYTPLSIIMIILISCPLYADKLRIAVMNFESSGVTELLSQTVSELIRIEMINCGKYNIIERDQLNKILKEQNIQQSGCTDVTCAVKVGKILSARKILIGTVMKIGDKIVITARIVDVQSGIGEFSAKQVAATEKELDQAVIILTKKLSQKIEGIEDFKYDPWYMGMEYQWGDKSSSIAINFSNSYGNKFYYGCNLGFKGIVTPYDVGVFAQLTFGINQRIYSDWFGGTLYGGIGLLTGTQTDYSITFDSKYFTPFIILGLKIPMGRGNRLCGPIFELFMLPSPEKNDNRTEFFFTNGFAHYW